MKEEDIKKIYQSNHKYFDEIFQKEFKEKGFGALFMDVLKNELKVYYLDYEKIPEEFQKKINKDKKNVVILSDQFIIYIQE
jgi:hypothetical protein